MTYELIKIGGCHSGSAKITFSKSGSAYLSSGACKRFNLSKYKCVRIHFDKEKLLFGIEPLEKIVVFSLKLSTPTRKKKTHSPSLFFSIRGINKTLNIKEGPYELELIGKLLVAKVELNNDKASYKQPQPETSNSR